jgi:hypothetical protein
MFRVVSAPVPALMAVACRRAISINKVANKKLAAINPKIRPA